MTRFPNIAILVSRFNEKITGALLRNCRRALARRGVPARRIDVIPVPGAYELPIVAQKAAESRRYGAIICLGCVIRGETFHDRHVAGWASHGIGMVALKTGVPTFFGVLTVKTEAQALRRARPGRFDRGGEVAAAAVETLAALRGLRRKAGR